MQSAVQFVVVSGQRSRGREVHRGKGKEREEDSHFPFSGGRKVGSLFVVRSTNMGYGAVYCVGDKEGEGASEGRSAFAK